MFRRERKNISGEKDNSGHEIEEVRIAGTNWYAGVEYRGQVARFHGELCINGFAATASGSRWIKHKGPFREEEMFELMRAAFMMMMIKKFVFKKNRQLPWPNGDCPRASVSRQTRSSPYETRALRIVSDRLKEEARGRALEGILGKGGYYEF